MTRHLSSILLFLNGFDGAKIDEPRVFFVVARSPPPPLAQSFFC